MPWSTKGYATKEDIENWIRVAHENGNKYLMVVNDTFSYEDYPVYAKNDEELQNLKQQYNNKNMQDIMRIYTLNK